MSIRDSQCWTCINYWKGNKLYGGTCPKALEMQNKKGCTAYNFNPYGEKIRTVGAVSFNLNEKIYNVGDISEEMYIESEGLDNLFYDMHPQLYSNHTKWKYNTHFSLKKFKPILRFIHINKIDYVEWKQQLNVVVSYEYWYWLYGTPEERERTKTISQSMMNTAYSFAQSIYSNCRKESANMIIVKDKGR